MRMTQFLYRKKGRRLGRVVLMLLMVFSLICAQLPSAFAEGGEEFAVPVQEAAPAAPETAPAAPAAAPASPSAPAETSASPASSTPSASQPVTVDVSSSAPVAESAAESISASAPAETPVSAAGSEPAVPQSVPTEVPNDDSTEIPVATEMPAAESVMMEEEQVSLRSAGAPSKGPDSGSGAGQSEADSAEPKKTANTDGALTAPEGSAVLAEVVKEEGKNELTETQSFSNDVPSVTVTETFKTTDVSDKTPEEKIKDKKADSTTYKFTESGTDVREEDQSKVSTTGAKVTVTASDPTKPTANPETGVTPDPEITITRVSVTESENAIQKSVDKALEKITEETKSITVNLQGYGDGCFVTVRTREHGEPILRIPVETCTIGKSFTGPMPAGLGEKEALYFSVEGKGGTFDFLSFDLA